MKREFTIAMAISIGLAARSDAQPGGTAPVRMVVTAETSRAGDIPSLSVEDVRVTQGKTNLAVTEFTPLGDSPTELYVLIDERVNPALAGQFEELRRFISAQPATIAVGIAYMDHGAATLVQSPTQDHKRAANALRLPTGDNSTGANPFTSLSALINGWSAAPRREVLVVTDGIDVYEDEPDNPWLDFAIADAQRVGVVVFSLFAPSAGHAGHSPALIQGGQSDLARLAEETGGEAYLGPSNTFELYLADLAQHLAHQYKVTFWASPSMEKTTFAEVGLQWVAVSTSMPNVELISARRFYLKATERAK